VAKHKRLKIRFAHEPCKFSIHLPKEGVHACIEA
jgi:hypothetical protein